MSLSPSKVPSAPLRTFRSLVLSPDVEVILEGDGRGICPGIDLAALQKWLGSVKKDGAGETPRELTLNDTFKINPSLHTIFIRGFKISDFAGSRIFICSPLAPTWIVISYKDFESVFTALEYLYHMESCI